MSSTLRPEVLVVGEALIDVIERAGSTIELPGGSAANTAVALARLGRAVTLATALGDDARGRTLRGWLGGSGVTVETTPIGRTSTATARLASDGSASYVFDLDWRVDRELRGAAIIHTGSLAAVVPPGAAAVEDLLDRCREDTLLSIDPNVRRSFVGDDDRRRLLRLVEKADIVKLSEEDLDWLSPGRPVADAATQWLAGRAGIVVVTRAERGIVGFTRDGEVDVAAAPTAVIDTVGAGDTVSAALLDGLLSIPAVAESGRPGLRELRTCELLPLLERCARAAAITVGRAGANPPTGAEVAITPPT
ncbi:PfkB family carbohydrate kinase [Leifsonia aquatica]|uniref:PfkB family carbohydrate kinase n=1 Tax=Leifsonia aquatica TaxID=144185 RepID=UPI0028AD6863|nr:PfkB family carbohydrate kinase [Leifsonia aquatica]